MHGLSPQMTKSKDRDPDTGGAAGLRRNTAFVSLSYGPNPTLVYLPITSTGCFPSSHGAGTSKAVSIEVVCQYLAPCSQCILRSQELCSHGLDSPTPCLLEAGLSLHVFGFGEDLSVQMS